MILKAIIHEAEEGGYWAEVSDLPECVSQGENLEELRANIREAKETVTQSEVAEPTIEFHVKVKRR